MSNLRCLLVGDISTNMKLRSFKSLPLVTRLGRNIETLARMFAILGLAVGTLPAANNYRVHNLVSDLPGVADHQDKNLVNAWGNGFSGNSPFWIGNNGTGTATPLVPRGRGRGAIGLPRRRLRAP